MLLWGARIETIDQLCVVLRKLQFQLEEVPIHVRVHPLALHLVEDVVVR